MSIRTLKAKVPLHLRRQLGNNGKVLVKLSEFDAWFEQFRQGRPGEDPLTAMEEEMVEALAR